MVANQDSIVGGGVQLAVCFVTDANIFQHIPITCPEFRQTEAVLRHQTDGRHPNRPALVDLPHILLLYLELQPYPVSFEFGQAYLKGRISSRDVPPAFISPDIWRNASAMWRVFSNSPTSFSSPVSKPWTFRRSPGGLTESLVCNFESPSLCLIQPRLKLTYVLLFHQDFVVHHSAAQIGEGGGSAAVLTSIAIC